ncbi:hypothetical protein PLICRDRAFT_605524 [Plicaturopsis crispa FD-325 SS-3]|nr:hypothetical protein PLICRDRAFT_605524 [Plicaturopsis crispa FD-325 SS-3]
MSTLASSSSRPNHRQAEPGPSILRTTIPDPARHLREQPERQADPISDITSRFEKLARPQTSREDYYGPHARITNATTDENDLMTHDKRPFRHEINVGRQGFETYLIAVRGPASPIGGRSASLFDYTHEQRLLPSGRTTRPVAKLPIRRSGSPLLRPWTHQPDHSRDAFKDAIVDHWLAGPGHGPVLKPILLHHVDTSLDLNPLLCPPSGEAQQQNRIDWEIVFPSSYARCSHEVSAKAWSEYLRSPATFPRTRKIYIVCRSLPWVIQVNPEDASIGITCGDVLDEIYSDLYIPVLEGEVQALSPLEITACTVAYRANRTRKDAHGEPASSLLKHSPAMRRLDWLARNIYFGGLARDDAYIVQRFGIDMPAAFVLHSHETAIGAN